ncbi:methyltransferase domain-containing protein [Alisedimentitalea sp. MJ-SS2]|uniref:methyltransferase domain-containing protein n=1 Tax=Aliisedimentitalea sp. MJ-SS2 TaxID=3049795 RepID=UPI00290D5E8F|nr:methyltransferase domain-containing protein [Alisedimentitalea sp. MJ-SS2]MDU8927294.1 methyltransferase domain-containing protein [Alisedimentitalea sp. MJ-SS2]
MSADKTKDWNPGAYGRFRDLRLRPALDLMGAVRSVGGGDVIDLGCGSGAMGESLKARFVGHRLVGVDASPAMLEKAGESDAYDALDQADIGDWQSERCGLIFSNAALHWLGDHEALMPRLAGMLAPGGTLAVQMPRQNNAPSHRLWRQLASEYFPDRVDFEAGPGVMEPARYFHLLSGLGTFTLWESEYYQVLPAEEDAHPVRRFTESTYARPILEALDEGEQEKLIAAYEAVMEKAYPRGEDGTVLFPFRRMFFTLTV